jgi:hypothetical protein
MSNYYIENLDIFNGSHANTLALYNNASAYCNSYFSGMNALTRDDTSVLTNYDDYSLNTDSVPFLINGTSGRFLTLLSLKKWNTLSLERYTTSGTYSYTNTSSEIPKVVMLLLQGKGGDGKYDSSITGGGGGGSGYYLWIRIVLQYGDSFTYTVSYTGPISVTITANEANNNNIFIRYGTHVDKYSQFITPGSSFTPIACAAGAAGTNSTGGWGFKYGGNDEGQPGRGVAIGEAPIDDFSFPLVARAGGIASDCGGGGGASPFWSGGRGSGTYSTSTAGLYGSGGGGGGLRGGNASAGGAGFCEFYA